MVLLYMNEDRFEYDIRALLMEFYPGEEIRLILGEENAAEDPLESDALKASESEAKERETEAPKESDSDFLRVTYLSSGETELTHCHKGVCKEQTVPVTPGFAEEAGRRQHKTDVKCAIYRMISEALQTELPWGSLTGIRPTKLATEMLAAGLSKEEIIRNMEEVYLVSHKKAVLSEEIASREHAILSEEDYKSGYSLYIGIPFCPTRCLYCSFTGYPIAKWKEKVDEYITAVIRELDQVAESFRNKRLYSVYMGGGTPTTLEPEQLDRLLTAVEERFDMSSVKELTVEAGRPDSVTREKLRVLKAHHVDRISINPQTMKAETLKIIGRGHTPDQIREAFAMAREEGFESINMDLILGLPDETAEDVERTMQEIEKMHPDNLTVHSLAIKRAARLNIERDQYRCYAFENSEDIMAITDRYARKMGMVPYYLYRQKNMAGNLENIGFSGPETSSAGLYNILIMEEIHSIVAVGAGSISKCVHPSGLIERQANAKDVKVYLERLDEELADKKALFEKLLSE